MSRRPRSTASSDAARLPAAGARSFPWGHVALIVGAVLAVYANTSSLPFVFDDASTVVDNTTIRSLAGSLAGGPVQSATAGRPLVNLTLALNYAVSGTAPWSYHLVNALIVALCAALLYALVGRALSLPRVPDTLRTRATGIALASALLWGVHPLLSETVDYVTQRTESLMGLAYLATLYAGVRAASAEAPMRWTLAAIVACAAGMATKESMATAPLAMLLLDAALVTGSLRESLVRRRVLYGGLVATWLVLAGLNVAGPRWRSAGFASGVSPWTYLLNQAPMLVRYLRVSVLPVGLVLDYGIPGPVALSAVWPQAALIVALLVGVVVAWLGAPLAALAGTLFFVLLAPTSSFVPIATEVGAERRMFLPLAVLVVSVVAIAARQFERLAPEARSRAARATVAMLALVLGALTVQRNTEYTTGPAIWQTVIDRWDHGRAHYNLGVELRRAGRRAEAIAAYERAAADTPEAHYALGFERQEDQQYDRAAEHYRTYIRLRPMDANVLRAYHQLGRTLMAQEKHEEALAAFQEVLTRAPGNLDALSGTADTLLALKRWPDAIAAYERYLAANPENIGARFNLGLALFEVDQFERSAAAFQAVIARDPSNVGAYVNLANAVGSMGRYSDAVRALQRAAELEKDPAMRDAILASVRQILGH